MPLPALSIIVPVHAGGAVVGRCLEALGKFVRPTDELIVVLDGLEGVLKEAEGLPVRTVRLSERLGPARARNAGASAARRDILLFIDSDVEVHPETLEAVRAYFADDPELDALIGSYDDSPGDSSSLSRYRNLLHHFTHQHAEEAAQTFWGACGAVRRRTFDEIGGFDERYRQPSVEDIELGYRLSARGGRIVLRPDVQVKHLKNWSLTDIVRTDVLRRAAPWTRLLLTYRSLPSDLNLRWRQRWSIVLAYAGLLNVFVGLWATPALIALPFWLVGLYLLNYEFHTFLKPRLSARSRLAAHLWHWLFYLCAGAGAIIGLLQYVYSGGRFVAERSVRRTAFGLTTLG